MGDIRDTYRSWAEVPASVQRAVEAYDAARRTGTSEAAMSERNKLSIAPMIAAALDAVDSGRIGRELAEAVRADGSEDRYAALGRACESNGLGWFGEGGQMLFQAPADVIAEQAVGRALSRQKASRNRGAIDRARDAIVEQATEAAAAGAGACSEELRGVVTAYLKLCGDDELAADIEDRS